MTAPFAVVKLVWSTNPELEWAVVDRKGITLGQFDTQDNAQLFCTAKQTAHAASIKCWCRACRDGGDVWARMILCPDCGCKRCPKATHHDHACTQSNDGGQVGSCYGVPCQLPCCNEYREQLAEKMTQARALRNELDEIRGER